MTRECTHDFTALQDYISNYSIAENLSDRSYVDAMKSMHKCYFSAITWHAEISSRKEEINAEIQTFTSDVWLRISETVSDLGASLFNWINGSYKTSRIMLRAGIENFIRAVGAIEDPTQLKEKNVFKLFESSASLEIFNKHAAIKGSFSQLHADYKILCGDTHTASFENMDQLSSLDGLPVYRKKKAGETKDIFVRTTKNLTLMICLLFNKFFHTMHHRNQENILNTVTKSMKPLIADFN
ncbi:hypothetical protein [Pseudomonas brassicacearum]|uniref:Uncharacterized protein n=1 Tax=Pseudomonas brassicacearum TaxID=930166 RepID=A0A423GV24_9PSED|nr:hypothetical protein [Pseudomonas brassicacearum]RON01306.1 hypothetical protein BK658_09080 [Pseudomonas brassicacearum]